MEDIKAASSKEVGYISSLIKEIKLWLFSQSQHLSFLTILVLASVPNPLFDLAGIMCGQFGIPFWKFFLATLVGKAIIKTHIQTTFIISVCNNQLLEFVEKKMIWILRFIPSLSSILPNIISKLHKLKEKYLSGSMQPHAPPNSKEMAWNLSFAFVWNTFVWLMLMNFFAKIVTATAQKYLKQQQELEIAKKQPSNKRKKAKTK
ncbi:hypothetical protein AXF42_Ash013582 [Apostasia shenzhenica]|uniref:Vacuole membrane protein KMS1 n=1 Tax=Apostasia shenzhenica TaxID=1088818 RepID=A0A2I0APE2_9ASPA|nr:hypothetical protein AXF42_Ash013582 [Apostasia shenzhenica]